jgi:putative transposase
VRNVEDLLFERGIDLCHETVRQWWNRFGPMFAVDKDDLVQAVSRAFGFAATSAQLRSVLLEVIEALERDGTLVSQAGMLMLNKQ